MKVNFLIGGTEPAGINQLYFLLSHHQEICVPRDPQPEPNFFSKDAEFDKGVEYYHQRFFSHYDAQLAVGEKSGRYLWHPAAPGRIHEYNPDMRLIFMFRDPVQRAFSNYRFNCLNGMETLGFGEALEAEDRRMEEMACHPCWKDVQPYAYYDKGLYARQLERYLEQFPSENLVLLRNDELRNASEATVREILQFLGLSEKGYTHVEDSPEFASFHVRSLWIQRAFKLVSHSFLEKAIMNKRMSGRPPLLHRFAQLNLTEHRPAIPAVVVGSLRERYREEMLRLQKLVPFSIADWM